MRNYFILAILKAKVAKLLQTKLTKVKINQSDFIELLAARCGITATQADEIISSFKRLTYESLADGHSIELSGFGQFSTSHRMPRIGVHPRTLEKITIPELRTAKFKAGEALKKAVALKK